MFINEQIELLMNKVSSTTNSYHTPFCAPCPMCGGSNSWRPRVDAEKLGTIWYIECINCGKSGTVSEWLDMLETDNEEHPGKSSVLSEIFNDSFSRFEEGYFKEQRMINNVGYLSPDIPPNRAFSLIHRDVVDRIKTVKSYLRYRDFYIAIPCYRHVGLMDDILLCDGSRFERLSQYRDTRYESGGYCGRLSEQCMPSLFIAESPKDLLNILGRQQKEGVDSDSLPIIADMSRSCNNIRTLNPGRIQADKIYVLSKNKSICDSMLNSYPKSVAGELRVICDYEKHSIARIANNAMYLSERLHDKSRVAAQMSLKKLRYPYRFFVKGHNIYAHSVFPENAKGFDIEAVVSGLIYVTKETSGNYRIKLKKLDRAFVDIREVPYEMFIDTDTFNSYIVNKHKEKKGSVVKKVMLLDWFANRSILPNLLMISEKTEEYFNTHKEVPDVD